MRSRLSLIPSFFQSPDGYLWNVTANPGAAGAVFRTDDIAGVSYPLTKLDVGAIGATVPVSLSAPLPVRLAGSTATITKTNAATSNTTVQASVAGSLKRWLYNDSTSAAYVKLGATATSDDFTKRMLPFESWEVIGYTGQIDAIWDTANGKMRATDITA